MMTERSGESNSLAYDVRIGKDGLQKLQDRFCEATSVFACFTDKSGRQITAVSGNTSEWQTLEAGLDRERFRELFLEVINSPLEDQMVGDAGIGGVKAAVQSVRMDGKTVGIWIVVAVLGDGEVSHMLGEAFTTVTTQRQMYLALDLLGELSSGIFRLSSICSRAEAESRRSRFSEQEMSRSLKRIGALTEIVQLLESEDVVEKVLSMILRTAGSFLEVSSAQVFRIHGNEMDVLAEWCAPGVTSYFNHTRNLGRMELLRGERLTVITGDTPVPDAEKKLLRRAHVKSTVIVPIRLNGNISMYACFNECRKEKDWSAEDIKFINDGVKIMQSILGRRIQQNSLASSYVTLEAILDNAGSAIYVKDNVNGKVLFANRILKEIFEKELADGSFDSLIEKALAGGRKNNIYEISYLERNRWYDLYYTEIKWVDGRTASLCALYDISDKKIYQRKIEQQAYTDFLTGLFNRMCCERDLAWQVDKAKKCGEKGALLYLDLDDFKHINDGLGHQYGDVLLKAISHSLQRIEGIDNSCYRMGGDEFVIIVPAESYQRFENIIDEIREIFSKPWFLKDADYYCTMSMGIVTFPDDGESVQELIKKADIAMYEAKKSGKNRVAEYTEGIASSSNKRLDMEKNMRDATVEGYREFEVYYQPIIDTRQKGAPCSGAEALIRWNSSELGFISPAEFIPLAEYLGLINPIGNHVLRTACGDCRMWNENGHPGYKVNVNLSVVQLLQTDIVDIVKNTIKETGIRPGNLTLEVTESLAINDMDRMKEILGNIRELGVRIALDDFGTGYSSLNHIREIPLDVIKVDQSFVKDLAKDTYSQSFIKMVAELADAIGVNVCVEGIETKEQYEVLEGMKVSLIQGFYFDRPMPRKEFEQKYINNFKS